MSDTKDLVITHTFDAPVEQVWNAWVDPKLVKQWWGPDGFSCPRADMHVKEGETSLVAMLAPAEFGGQESYSTWKYTKIVPMERMEYIHNLADKDGKSIDPTTMGMPADFPQNQRHTIVFKKLSNNKTELTVTEHAWPAGQMREFSELGMKQCLTKMAKALAEEV